MMVLLVLIFAFAGIATAGDSNYLFDQETIVTGMVEQNGDNFILQAVDGDQYTITGQDLADLVGKKVQATGELIIDQNENWLNVNEVVELRNEWMDLYATPIEHYGP